MITEKTNKKMIFNRFCKLVFQKSYIIYQTNRILNCKSDFMYIKRNSFHYKLSTLGLYKTLKSKNDIRLKTLFRVCYKVG